MGFTVSVVLLMGIIAVVSFVGIQRLSVASKSLERSRQIVHKEAEILQHVTAAIDWAKDYILTGKEEPLRRYRMAKGKILGEFEALQAGLDLGDQEIGSLER